MKPKLWDKLKRPEIPKILLSLKKNRVKFAFGLSAAILIASSTLLANIGTQKIPVLDRVSLLKTGVTLTSAQMNDYSQYPNVQKFEVANAKGTVIYYPQVHKDPTTQAADPKNDQAAVAQKEIYQNLDKMVNEGRVSYVMDETDLYGPMPQEKVDKMKQGFSDVDTTNQAADKVSADYVKDGGNQSQADSMNKSAKKATTEVERNLYLTGGAAVLAAKNDKAHVYGSQNEATLNDARVKLENLNYLQQRIQQLQQAQQTQGMGGSAASTNPLAKILSGKAAITSATGSTSTSAVQSILGGIGSGSVNTGVYNPANRLAQQKGDTQLQDDVTQATSDLSKMSPSRTFEATVRYSDVPHANNPYTNETDMNKLQSEYNQAYADFLKVAKDQRSAEAADNVVKMMDENHVKTAALVFGAQHQDELVSALNAKGYNVVVVMTPTVKEYQTQYAAAQAQQGQPS